MYKSRIPQIAAELNLRTEALLAAAAAQIVEGAKERVPVGKNPPHLRDAIHVERGESGEYLVVAGDKGVFYGHIVEHGSVNAPPHPFLVPAAEDVRARVDKLGRQAFRNFVRGGLANRL